MPFKPIPQRVFESYLKRQGWKLEKGKIDWNVYDEKDTLACSIKISHGKNTKSKEVIAHSIKKIEKEFIKRGLEWPPRKK
jgi:hypothetical protein